MEVQEQFSKRNSPGQEVVNFSSCLKGKEGEGKSHTGHVKSAQRSHGREGELQRKDRSPQSARKTYMGSGQLRKERGGTKTSENWHLIKVSGFHKCGQTQLNLWTVPLGWLW